MAAVIGLKNPEWDLNKGQFSDTDEMFLMSSPGPVCTIVAAYMVFVMRVGPAYMRKREAFKLTGALVIYNAIQVAISVVLVSKFIKILLETGPIPRKCYMNEENSRKEFIFGMWMYFIAKVTELLDTVFFVLRKKQNQVTFLHLYHHSSMVIFTWLMLKYTPAHNLVFTGFMNSLVHVLMYTYYGLSALGPNVAKYLTWKKYMTSFQLVQFVSIIFQYIASVCVSECPPSKGVAIFYACNSFFFLYLFANFYRASYNKKNDRNALHVSKSVKTLTECEKIQ